MAGVLNDESAVGRCRPYRRRATVNSQARACSGVNCRSRRQEDSASANVSAVNATATSASSVRRAKNNRTLSLSRSYIRENGLPLRGRRAGALLESLTSAGQLRHTAGVSDSLTLTAVFTPDENGWTMAQLAEWPAVVTCGRTVEEARAMLLDAAREMIASYHDEGREPPIGGGHAEPITIDLAA